MEEYRKPFGNSEIPEDVRRKTISPEFTWVTNVGPDVYQDPRFLMGGTLGKPKATEVQSEEALINMGMAGLYRRSGPP